MTDEAKTEEQYGAFNDPSVWEPKFAAGEIPAQMRFVVDEPLQTGTLWTVARYARLANEDRARSNLLDVNGPVVVKRRVVTTTPWEEVSLDAVEEALGI